MTTKQNRVRHIKTLAIFRLRPLSACVRMVIAGSVFIGSVAPVHAELPVPAQTWVTMGEATNRIVGNTLQVDLQKVDRAILNWDSFNVGANNQVQFNQRNSSSIALNRIFQDDPSKILGKVTANGQIYLYNKTALCLARTQQSMSIRWLPRH